MILIGSVCCSWKVESGGGLDWLRRAEGLRDSVDDEVRFFAAVEVDARGTAPVQPLLDRLGELGGEYWTYSIDTGASELTTGERLIRICEGRNLVREYAMRTGADAILHLDSDVKFLPNDALQRLLEVNAPLVAGQTPVYSHIFQVGPWDGPNCRIHWASAGCLLVRREAFKLLLWSTDPDDNLTDDPAYNRLAVKLGFPETRVRQDVIYEHEPLRPVEQRLGDRRIYRAQSEDESCETPTFVVIPTIRRHDLLRNLIRDLAQDRSITEILVFDNGHDAAGKRELARLPELDSRVRLLDGSGIYPAWQAGAEYALTKTGNRDANLLALNDDVRLPYPRTAQVLARYLRSDSRLWLVYPDYHASAPALPFREQRTRGTYRNGGMCGWGWMLKAEAQPIGGLPPLDTGGYEHWCGDDELALNVERAGYEQARIVGLPILHEGEATASLPEFSWTHAAKARDVELFKQRWPGEWKL